MKPSTLNPQENFMPGLGDFELVPHPLRKLSETSPEGLQKIWGP